MHQCIELEDSPILINITKKRMKSLDRAVSQFLPKNTRKEEDYDKYRDFGRLKGSWAESMSFRYLDISGERIGFLAVRDLGYKEGLLNIVLPSDCLDQLFPYLKNKDIFWYKILQSSYRKSEAA